jgi:hypothetical protein
MNKAFALSAPRFVDGISNFHGSLCRSSTALVAQNTDSTLNEIFSASDMHSESVYEDELRLPSIPESKQMNSNGHIAQTFVCCDLIRFLQGTNSHREQLKDFIHTYSEIAEAVSECRNSLLKIDQRLQSGPSPSKLLVKFVFDVVSVINTCLTQSSVDEMKRMKTVVKEKIASYDSDLKRRSKDLEGIKQSLDRAENSHKRLQEDLKRNHAKSLEPITVSGGFMWKSPCDDKDKMFEKIQRQSADLNRLSVESELEYNNLTNKHISAYTRFTVVVSELQSIRRRMNRRMAMELKNLSHNLCQGMRNSLDNQIPLLIENAGAICPSSGDFGMKLSAIDQSLSALVGDDREHRIRSMSAVPSLIEFRAVQSYYAKEEGELSFKRNERIEITRKDTSGWWRGRNEKGEEGIFPCVLVVQRPAGATLPLQQKPAVSYRPNLLQGTSMGTWKSFESCGDSRAALVMNYPNRVVGIAQFRYSADGINVEPGEVVEVISNEADRKVRVRNQSGMEGLVPMNILNLKKAHDTFNQENLVNFNNL